MVDGLDLEIGHGELFGFLGPNGAGKTTTIRILTTLTKPSSGQVKINGIDVAKDPASVKSELGIVQPHLSLNRDLTISENLELHARLHHLSKKERKERITDLLDYVELSDHADYLIDDVSGGMKRRAMIARALIRRMNSEGTTVFLTTHYIEEAEALCQRVGVLHRGRIIAIGSPLSLRQKLGMIAVEMNLNGNGTEYRYFADRAEAAQFIETLPSTECVVMRESNLEDVFIELTGQKVLGG